jgi:hypothetical protein
MFKALVCYVFNGSPETPRLCRMLDGVIRQMIKNRSLEDMKFQVEKTLPVLQRLLDSRGDLIPLATFTPIDPLAFQVDPLELPSKTTSPSWITATQFRQVDGIILDGEKGTRELARKRRRLSL